MTAAVFKETNYAPRVRYVSVTYDSGVGNSNISTVHPIKYLYHSKPASVSGVKFVGTDFRRPTGWSMVWKHVDSAFFGVVQYRHSGNSTVRYEGHLPIDHGLPGYSFPGRLYARAELDALLKLKDEKVNVGVSLGERKQVAGMFKSNLTKVANAYRSARRGNFVQAARQLGLSWKDVPNRWLELQYGWKPLLSDIYEATKAINDKDREDSSRNWIHVIGKAVDTSKDQIDGGTAFNGVTTRSYDLHHHEAKVRFDFRPKDEMRLQRSLDQWGISNPLHIAWELIPFSFVFDWAVPVGDYLSAMGASVPYDWIAGSQTRFSTTTRKSHLRANSSFLVSASGEAFSEQKVFYRYLYNNFPLPDPRALLASSNPSQQTIATRCANALALLSSAVK